MNSIIVFIVVQVSLAVPSLSFLPSQRICNEFVALCTTVTNVYKQQCADCHAHTPAADPVTRAALYCL